MNLKMGKRLQSFDANYVQFSDASFSIRDHNVEKNHRQFEILWCGGKFFKFLLRPRANDNIYILRTFDTSGIPG